MNVGDTMSTSGDVQYIGGISWVYRGHIMSTSGDVQYIGGISWYMWGSNLIKSFQFLLKTPMYSWYPPDVLMISPQCTHGIPRCTEHPPMYSWYPPACIMISPRCTEHPPMYSWYPPNVLMVSLQCTEHPRCTHGIPPMYSWYPPDVLMVSPRCTYGIPLMYWTPPDVLNIPRCTEHTLYRVVTPILSGDPIINARLIIFQKNRSGNEDLKKVHQMDLNPGPHDRQPSTLTTRLPTAAAESTESLSYLCTHLINVYVASPDPDRNPRGGGQLPNPKSAILR